MTTQQEYDHNRYMANRDARIEAQRAYYRDYESKGLKKPRKPYPHRRKERQREYYLENREAILEKQRIYRETHKAEIRDRRRKRNFEKRYGKKEL